MPLLFANGTFEEWIYWYQVTLTQGGTPLMLAPPMGQILAVRLADPVQSCQHCGGTGIFNGCLICRCSLEIRAN